MCAAAKQGPGEGSGSIWGQAGTSPSHPQTLCGEAVGWMQEPGGSHLHRLLVSTELDAGKSEGGMGSGDRGQAVREGKVPGGARHAAAHQRALPEPAPGISAS